MNLERAGDCTSTHAEEKIMAKGQVRSNREIRKPKKDKSATIVPPTLGSQVKDTSGATGSGKKHK
jgi:hypothetical protein